MAIPEEKDKVSTQDTKNTRPQTDDCKTIYDESLPKGQITLFEAADKTSAYLKIVSTTSGEQFTKDEILEIINEIGVKSEININQIEKALATLKDQGDIVKTIKITASSPSAASEKAALEIFFSLDNPFVEEGEMLLKVLETEKSGKDIYGNEITLSKGTKPDITLGENVIEKNPGEYFSQCLGRVSFENNILSIKNFLK